MGARKRLRANSIKEARKQKSFAILRNCPTSPIKMRLVADQIRGIEVEKALNILYCILFHAICNPIDNGRFCVFLFWYRFEIFEIVNCQFCKLLFCNSGFFKIAGNNVYKYRFLIVKHFINSLHFLMEF